MGSITSHIDDIINEFGSWENYLAIESSKEEKAGILLTKQARSIQSLERERFIWSLETFPKATATSSLLKCEEEIDEIKVNIFNGVKDPEEYADAIMCLFDSAGRDGISVDNIIEAFEMKLAKNKLRTWVKNADNTYSHQK